MYNRIIISIVFLMLPRDILVEIALLDWRIYNSLIRADKALNARLSRIDSSLIANFSRCIIQKPGERDPSDTEIASWHRLVIADDITGFTRVYKDGVIRWSLVYDIDDQEQLARFIELERYITRDGVRYTECVNFFKGAIDSITRQRFHPRGYMLWDTYTKYSHSLRFDDYYLSKRTASRYEDPNMTTWRIHMGDFYIYDYTRVTYDDSDGNVEDIIY